MYQAKAHIHIKITYHTFMVHKGVPYKNDPIIEIPFADFRDGDIGKTKEYTPYEVAT
jgi:hypothetical protein